jgi:hypothetical protein
MLRGKKLKQTTLAELQRISLERNHELLTVETSKKDSSIVPQQNKASFCCKKCGHQWETKVYVYLQRTGLSLGCCQCYNIMLQDETLYPQSPCRKKNVGESLQTQPTRRAGKKILREVHSKGAFGHINNIEDCIQYLKNNPNPYNDLVLTYILRAENFTKQNRKFKELFPGNTSMHHIFPLHAGGSPDNWNLVPVTKEEHHQLHEIRYQVFGEKQDKLATYGTKSDEIRAKTGVFQQLKTPKARYSSPLAPEVFKILERGLVFKHRDGFEGVVLPNSVKTMKQIQQVCLDVLPENHPDKIRILKNKTSVNYLRSLIITNFPLEGSVLLMVFKLKA